MTDNGNVNLIGCAKARRYVRNLHKFFFAQVVFDPLLRAQWNIIGQHFGIVVVRDYGNIKLIGCAKARC